MLCVVIFGGCGGGRVKVSEEMRVSCPWNQACVVRVYPTRPPIRTITALRARLIGMGGGEAGDGGRMEDGREG